MIDIGLSEALNKLVTGNEATSGKILPLYSNVSGSPMGSWPQGSTQPSSGMLPGESFLQASQRNKTSSGYTPTVTTGGTSAAKKSSGGNAGTKSSGTSISDQQAALRKKLGSSFGSTINAYKDMIGWLPNEQSALQEQVGNLAETQKRSVNDALGAALEKYKGYRGEVETNQKRTLQDLANNTINLFSAGNNYLGARGAGNSSATGMYSAALTQQANRQRSDIQGQSNDMYNDINMQEADTQAQTQQQLDAIETWKATRVSEIVQQYQDLRRQLTLAKAQADDSKKAALAKLDASLFQSAISNLNNIQSMAASYKDEVSQALGQQNQQLSGVLQGIGNSAKYDVQDIQRVPLDGIEQGQSMADGTIIGYYQGRRVQVDQDGNLLAYLD